MGFERIIAFILGVPILIIIEIFRFIKAKKLNKKFMYVREIFIILFSFYIMTLVAITILPIDIGGFYNEPNINFIPVLNTINDMARVSVELESFMIKFWIVNILGNILLLMPLAIFIPIIFKKFRNLKSTVILCFLVSLSIETLQYLSMFLGNMRSADIDDLILNTLGAFLGYLILNFASTKFKTVRVKM